MRIDKLDSALTYSINPAEKQIGETETEQKQKALDSISISEKTSIEMIKSRIKSNIEKLENQPVSEKKLKELKKKIDQGDYHIDTDDIVNSII
jgi:anti-sigma28 factor (negative regulator of flagellin synthesis)